MGSRSLPARASLRLISAVSTFSFSSPSNFSPWSFRSFSVWYTRESALLRTSASSLRFRSSSAWASASFTMRSMSSLAIDDWPVMVIDCSLPVARSLADTCTMPLASMSKVTSIRHATGGGGQVDQLELAQGLVVHRHLALALEHVDLDRGLVVVGGGEHLAPLGRDGGVALDEAVHDRTLGFDAQRQRGHIEEQDVLDLALQHAGLDGGTDGHHLVRVDALVGLLAGQRLDQVLDRRDAGRSADEDHEVDVGLGQP